MKNTNVILHWKRKKLCIKEHLSWRWVQIAKVNLKAKKYEFEREDNLSIGCTVKKWNVQPCCEAMAFCCYQYVGPLEERIETCRRFAVGYQWAMPTNQ